MPTIALTGNFGMGKTSVLQMFRELGVQTYDVDSFVHQILTMPHIINKIERILGENIRVDSSNVLSVDKTRIAKIIFTSSDKRKAVENIIHPRVLKVMEQTKSKIFNKNPSALVMFEVPLLFETGYNKFFDKTIVVWCKRLIAINRLNRKGFSEEESLKRLKAQMPITKKKTLADFVIDNNYSLSRTKKRVHRIYREICNAV